MNHGGQDLRIVARRRREGPARGHGLPLRAGQSPRHMPPGTSTALPGGPRPSPGLVRSTRPAARSRDGGPGDTSLAKPAAELLARGSTSVASPRPFAGCFGMVCFAVNEGGSHAPPPSWRPGPCCRELESASGCNTPPTSRFGYATDAATSPPSLRRGGRCIRVTWLRAETRGAGTAPARSRRSSAGPACSRAGDAEPRRDCRYHQKALTIDAGSDRRGGRQPGPVRARLHSTDASNCRAPADLCLGPRSAAERLNGRAGAGGHGRDPPQEPEARRSLGDLRAQRPQLARSRRSTRSSSVSADPVPDENQRPAMRRKERNRERLGCSRPVARSAPGADAAVGDVQDPLEPSR